MTSIQTALFRCAVGAVGCVARDYDRGWERLEDLGADDDGFLFWRDIGLLDGDGTARLGLEVWDRWLAMPRR